MKKGNIHIGTSGWNYKHWMGTFYPKTIKQSDQFTYYKNIFDTVELNNSFYHLPPIETFKGWNKKSPAQFLFSVKASRYITHMKKLHETDDALDLFLKNAEGLGKKLGPILFQLPPGWKVNIERLETFLQSLPKKHRYVFEFRNDTWYIDEVYTRLRENNCAFCLYELNGHQSPQIITADFVYIRLHGPGAKYQGSYPKATLKKWADIILDWQNKGIDTYLYFDNDQAGYAAFNAQTLKQLTSPS
jgi:uncharacterized protein YecE (DUF72 family)